MEEPLCIMPLAMATQIAFKSFSLQPKTPRWQPLGDILVFVNIRDHKGASPLHLAARQRRPECVHMLLDNGALVCASTGGYGFPGSTPLHLAARSGSLDCIRELLAWGADRLQRDASGRIPYTVALTNHHGACAASLNPSSTEPLVWPSPLKFISELNHEAKALLERALMEANRERENAILKGTVYSMPSPLESDCGIDNVSEASDTDLCCICFDQVCTIELFKNVDTECVHNAHSPCAAITSPIRQLLPLLYQFVLFAEVTSSN